MILLFTGRTSSFESSQPSCYFKLLMGMSQIFGYAHHSQPNGGPQKKLICQQRNTSSTRWVFVKTRSENETLRSRGQKDTSIKNDLKRTNTKKNPPKTTTNIIENHRKPAQRSSKTSKDHQQPSKTIKNNNQPSAFASGDHSAKVALATNCISCSHGSQAYHLCMRN